MFEAHQGAVIADRYELIALLGEGTFGEVWRARDTRLSNREVAVKILFPPAPDEEEGLARFDTEVASLSAIRHPGVVGVLDCGEAEDRQFLVTELLVGVTLRARIEDWCRGPRPPPIAVVAPIFDGICAAVAAAHSLVPPIIHRDLKPENILLCHDGEREIPRVIDFGLARRGERKGTRTGQGVGSRSYMAPEQGRGLANEVGPWTDVFALSVMLFEMLYLRVTPRPTELWWALASRGSGAVRVGLCVLPASVSGTVLKVLVRGLQAGGQDRFPDAAMLRDAAGRALEGSDSGRIRRALRVIRRRGIRFFAWVAARRTRTLWLAAALLVLAATAALGLALRPSADVRCDGGDGAACFEAGIDSESAGEPDSGAQQAVVFYERGCNLRYAEACMKIGDLRSRNPVDEREVVAVADAYSKACDAGHPEGCFKLGVMVEKGQSLFAPNPPLAKIYYRRACESGYKLACNRLNELLSAPPTAPSL